LVLTGDAPATAANVGVDILPATPTSPGGDTSDKLLSPSTGVITGSALTALAHDKANRAATQDNFIFAKLSLYMKLQIVEELRNQGHIVSFLGDSVNDTMAMRGADVFLWIRGEKMRLMLSCSRRVSA
jgi:magnesium-transporting ATPase (P-type)